MGTHHRYAVAYVGTFARVLVNTCQKYIRYMVHGICHTYISTHGYDKVLYYETHFSEKVLYYEAHFSSAQGHVFSFSPSRSHPSAVAGPMVGHSKA